MLNEKSQYINLTSGSTAIADNAERKYIPEIRTVYMSGKLRRLFEDRSKGIPILESGGQQRTPILDLKRLLKILLYGLGFGLVVTGGVFLFDKREGE
jgi:hypothetical protein